MNSVSSRGLVIVWLLALIVAGAYFRLHDVSEYYYSPDELSDITIAKGQTVADVITLSKFETHPAFSSILRHYLLRISDAPEFVRGVSAVFGLLCILVYYAVGKEVGGTLTGCAAAFFITFGYGDILLSQLVRNYTLLALFIGLACYAHYAFRRTQKSVYVLLYAVAGLLALMTHYSAIFALFCMYAACSVALIHDKKPRQSLYLWTLANTIFAIYFGYLYMTEIQHNAYEVLFHLNDAIASGDSFAHRMSLFVVYVPLTAAYFLFFSPVVYIPLFSVVLFLVSWICILPFNRPLFFETLLALGLGAFLLAANLYPYAFKVGGRNAMWVLPYIVLPVSVFAAQILQWAKTRVKESEAVSGGNIFVVMTGALAIGCALCSGNVFFEDRGEYLLKASQMEQLRNTIATFTKEDAVITGGLNVMYLLDDGRNYYHALKMEDESKSGYHVGKVGAGRLIFTRHYPPIIDSKELSMRESVLWLQQAHALDGVHTIWFFHTLYDPEDFNALIDCGITKKMLVFPSPPPGSMKDFLSSVELVGVPRDVLMKEVIPLSGRYSKCLGKETP